MIICKICGKKVNSVRGLCNHIRTHNIDSNEYIKIYGDFRPKQNKNNNLIECPICGKYNFSNLMSHVTWKHKITKEEFNKLYPNYICYTDGYKNQCSKAARSSLKSQMSNPKKWKESRKKAARTYDINNPGMRSKSARIAHANLSEELKERWKDPEYRKKMSDKCKKQHENGLTEKVIKSRGKRIPYKEFFMRSSWEVRLAEYLDNNSIQYEYEPFYIRYVDAIGKTRKYYPEYSIKDGYNFEFITENEIFDHNKLSNIIDGYRK